MAAAKPAAKAAPKKPATPRAKAPPSDAKLLAQAEMAEHEIQTIIETAAVSGWEPVHVEKASELAKVSAAARKQLGQDVPGHVSRFV